jgi:curved DNA-binding protein
MAKDFYQVLGVDKNASEAEIKKTFRRLAKQYHPDHNPDNKQAEARFKEINEAYETLGDPARRAQYDRFGGSFQGFPGSGAGSPGSYQNVDMNDMNDFIRSVFGSATRSGGRSAGGFPGMGGMPRTSEQVIRITLNEAYTGTRRVLERGREKSTLNIPPGVPDGMQLQPGGMMDDIIVTVKVDPHPLFERNGDDLTTEVKIDMFTALLGGEATVPTLGRDLKLKIQPGTQSGRKIRLAGKGMPLLNQAHQHGDLYARILITVPEQLTDNQRSLIEQLRASF